MCGRYYWWLEWTKYSIWQTTRLSAANNQILCNYIGTDVSGAADLGNNVWGVYLADGAANNTIGGTASGAANVIAYNGSSGIAIENTAGDGNAFSGNSIFSNVGLGIDLGNDGLTPNDDDDVDTGPNGLQNFPLLESAVATASDIAIVGTISSSPGTDFIIDFYASDKPDPTGHGEGKTYLGSFSLTTDAAGDAAINATFPAVVAQRYGC